MQQPDTVLSPGTRVYTAATLESAEGLWLQHCDARRPEALGRIQGVVGGYGGDVYWVKHDDGSIAPYSFTEFDLYAESKTSAAV